MRKVGTFEATDRSGVPQDAEPISGGPRFDPVAARRAVAGLIEASRGLSLDGLKIRDLIKRNR